jgi:hypothetical protein
MFEELLNEVGAFLVKQIKEEIKTPRPRFTNPRARINPRQMKRNSPYNFYASGNLYNSVEYKVVDDELYILMLDYGVDYVFGDGSYPGGGAYYPDTRPKGAKQTTSQLITQLTKWAQDKLKLSPVKAKGMAFAVRKNLFKSGYAGYNLYQEDFVNSVNTFMETLLEKPEYQDAALREKLGSIFDRINLLGTETYNIAIS